MIVEIGEFNNTYRKWSIKHPGRLFNFRTKRGGASNRYEAFIRRGRLFLI